MRTADLTWADPGPCPSWCIRSDHHLSDRLARGHDDYWHEGRTARVETEETDHNWNPIHVEVGLSQHVELASHRGRLHPVTVTIGGDGLSPFAARKLACLLLDLAAQAEDLSR
jgi:hypothetical protein